MSQKKEELWKRIGDSVWKRRRYELSGGALPADSHVATYRIYAFVGEDDRGSLYLAAKEEHESLFWLLELDRPVRELELHKEWALFAWQDKHYFALPTAGTTAATLAQLVYQVDWSFIGPRWIAVAKEMGHWHQDGRVYQEEEPFTLQDVIFDGNAQASIALVSQSNRAFIFFTAPEMAAGHPTAMSDVYALGASLAILLGESPPDSTRSLSKSNQKPKALSHLFSSRLQSRQVKSSGKSLYLSDVLKRATALEPAARYPDSIHFAHALATAIPATPKSRQRLYLYGWLALLLLLSLFWAAWWAEERFWPSSAEIPSATLFVEVEATPPKAPSSTDPKGLAFTSFTLDVGYPSSVFIKLALSQDGSPLPSSSAANFMVTLNEQVIPDLETSIDGEGKYRLTFNTPLPDNALFKVYAFMGEGVIAKTIYFYDGEVTRSTIDIEALANFPLPDDSATPTAQPVSATAQPVMPTAQPASPTATTEQIDFSQLDESTMQMATDKYPHISIYFTWLDEAGNVFELPEEVQLGVWQDGRVVETFSLTEVNPSLDVLTVALLLDVSDSMKGEPLSAARDAATTFIEQLEANDVVCLYRFATQTHLVHPCTSNHEALIAALESLQPLDDTALYDALLKATTDQIERSGRQAIVVLSDGNDTVSQAILAQTLTSVEQSNIPFYMIGLLSEQFEGTTLEEIADASSGSYLETPSLTALQTLYAQIQAQLKNQYRLDFTSVFPNRTSGTVTIRFLYGQQMVESSREFFVSEAVEDRKEPSYHIPE